MVFNKSVTQRYSAPLAGDTAAVCREIAFSQDRIQSFSTYRRFSKCLEGALMEGEKKKLICRSDSRRYAAVRDLYRVCRSHDLVWSMEISIRS